MPFLSLAPARLVLLVVDDPAGSLAAWLESATAGAIAELVSCTSSDRPATGIELVTCASPEAAASALASGRPYSALVARKIDPPLGDLATQMEIPMLTVAQGADPSGAVSALVALAAVATPVRWADRSFESLGRGPANCLELAAGGRPSRGRLVAVCGPGGTGASTVAAALAAAFGSRSTAYPGPIPLDPAFRFAARRPRVLLADLALRADQALFSGRDEPETGLLDLLEAGRYRPLTGVDARRHTIALAGYRLLPGLRRPGHWTAVSPAGVDTLLEGLVAIFDRVVADITADFEGEPDTGSLDVEERNQLARRTVAVADVVIVVGGPGANGIRRLALVVDDLLDHGVDPARIQPVFNRLPDRPPDRLPEGRPAGSAVGSRTWAPAHVCGLPAAPIELAQLVHDETWPLPPDAATPVVTAVSELLARLPAPHCRPAPVPVTPGSLGCRLP